MADLLSRLVASPSCLPQLDLEALLDVCRPMGFENVELFTTFSAAAVDPTGDAGEVRRRIEGLGFRVTSLHLPPVTENVDESLATAVAAAEFADRLGVEVVLFKAETRELYGRSAVPFLDAIADLAVTPVLQNHTGKAIATLEDFREVIDAVDDRRMRALLEVGHLARVGDDWREACEFFGDTVALVHVADIDAEGQSVPYGTGTVDFSALLGHLATEGYAGRIVVELALPGHRESIEPTVTEMRRAVELLCDLSA